MVRDVSTKIGPYGDALGTLCADWVCKKGVLRNFTKFTGKYLCQSLLFNKVADLPVPNLF